MATTDDIAPGGTSPALRVADAAITMALWLWFVFGYFFLFFPMHLVGWIGARDREAWSQKVNHLYMRSLLRALLLLDPRTRIDIAPEVKALSGCVVVANHRSYLDPILMVAAFPRQKTIVKGSFFPAPFLGWAMAMAGYLSSANEGPLIGRLARVIDRLPQFLSQGGNLFVFPEGTRRSTTGIGPLKRGAFSLARRCKAPVAIVSLSGTGRVFPPGSATVRTWCGTSVSVRLVAVLSPNYDAPDFSLADFIDEVRTRMHEARD